MTWWCLLKRSSVWRILETTPARSEFRHRKTNVAFARFGGGGMTSDVVVVTSRSVVVAVVSICVVVVTTGSLSCRKCGGNVAAVELK